LLTIHLKIYHLRSLSNIVSLGRLQCPWYFKYLKISENICKTSDNVQKSKVIFGNLRMIFGNLWKGLGECRRCLKMFGWYLLGWFLEVLRKCPIIFGYLRKASGELRPPSKYLGWPPVVFECLRTNFGYLHCNLHWCYKFVLVFQICTRLTWKLHSILANRVIFSSVYFNYVLQCRCDNVAI